MGAVHRVTDPTLRRAVAMKVIAEAMASDPEAVLRFELEAQITGQLAHPNIVPVHEFGVEAGGSRRYFVMRLVDGHDLSSAIHEGDGLPWHQGTLNELLGVFLKICDAIAFAHSRGVVHRDIKPENVMLGPYGQVYVMDWGVAVLRRLPGATHDPLDLPRSVAAQVECEAGTRAYMAPEQASGSTDRVDARTDVFLLGGVLYEMLTRRAPWQELPSGAADPGRSTSRTIPPPEEVHPGAQLPAALSRIAMRALAIDPDERYQDVPSLRGDVERYMLGADQFPVRTYEAGEVLVAEGDEGDDAFIIIKGSCVAYKSIEGRQHRLREMGPGDVFGETAVLTQGVRTATVQASTRMLVRVVTRGSFGEQLGNNAWLASFMRTLADRFREVDQRCTALQRELELERKRRPSGE
jgi:eukaryotic-like serine/threonine-protein kinase